MSNRNADFIAGLRQLADFIEENPSFKVPARSLTIKWQCCPKDPEIGIVAKMMGKCSKFNGVNTLGLKRKFGPIVLALHWWHFDVCRKVPAGKEIVKYPETWRSYEAPKYKWVCPDSFVKACCEEKP